jgi:hypothetical protein
LYPQEERWHIVNKFPLDAPLTSFRLSARPERENLPSNSRSTNAGRNRPHFSLRFEKKADDWRFSSEQNVSFPRSNTINGYNYIHNQKVFPKIDKGA